MERESKRDSGFNAPGFDHENEGLVKGDSSHYKAGQGRRRRVEDVSKYRWGCPQDIRDRGARQEMVDMEMGKRAARRRQQFLDGVRGVDRFGRSPVANRETTVFICGEGWGKGRGGGCVQNNGWYLFFPPLCCAVADNIPD
ncbi:hypothetical protein C8J57DRAFT_1473458 [Mycena rebaudengoi]|nr:hypothetical protein C8J57DRAFT_1473458 [Mycena rebaudengoi]